MSERTQGIQKCQLTPDAASELDRWLREASLTRIEIASEAIVDPKVVRKVLSGQSATLRSVRAVVLACRRLLRGPDGTDGEITSDWLNGALTIGKFEDEALPSMQTVALTQEPRIDLDLWLHRTGLGPDRFDERTRFDNLDSLLEATDYPFLLFLAEPGAGKTTLLKQYAAQSLNSTPSTLYARVEAYGGEPPLVWLSQEWQASTKRSAAVFRQKLRSGNLVLLLDGLSEGRIVRGEAPATTWSRIIRTVILNYPGNRVVVSCRQLEYNLPLKVVEGKVPIIRISGAKPVQVRRYLEELLGAEAALMLDVLEDRPAMLALCSNPMVLSVLAKSYTGGSPPDNRADLFRLLVWNALRLELSRHNGALTVPLLSKVDQLRLARMETEGGDVQGFPKGVLMQSLQKLAWLLQSGAERRLRLSIEEVRGVLGDLADDVVAVGCSLSLLTLDLEKIEVGFAHHLFQEFFAALFLTFEGGQDLAQDRWHPRTITASRIDGTGWEEVALFAAGLSPDPSRFIEEIALTNLPLAARSVEEVRSHIPADMPRRIQFRLVDRLRDANFSLDQRIAAGNEICDLAVVDHQRVGPAWVPPLIAVTPGVYRLGTPSPESLPRQHHAPGIEIGQREVEIGTLQTAAYPVTNIEYGQFIAEGGYQNERWWPSSEAQQWRDGTTSGEGMRWQLRQNRRVHLEWGEDYIREHVGIRWTPKEAAEMLERLRMSDAEFEQWVWAVYPDGQATEMPFFWDDPELNVPSQPIVGVSWYEATAYCLWLSHVTGKEFRLLSADEVEAAARASLLGMESRTYAFGETFSPELANLHLSGIGRPTPVGLYPPTPEGVYDLTGNVWTWTTSPDLSDGNLRMMTYGGSYDTSLKLAAAYARDSNHPGYHDRYVGFRVGVSLH